MSLAITNSIIVTMDAERSIIKNGTVLLSGNTIEKVGSAADVAIPPGYQVINKEPMLVLPGFINSHTHCALTALRGQAEDVNTIQAVYGLMAPLNNVLSVEDSYRMTKLAVAELLKFGSTTIVENSVNMEGVTQAVKEMGIRSVLVAGKVHDAILEKIKDGIYEYSPIIGEKTLASAVEFIEKWHGAEDGRIRCIFGPHATDTLSPELWQNVKKEADRLQVGITTHVAQNTRELEQVQSLSGLRPLAYLDNLGILNPAFIGAHCIFVTPEEIELLAKAGGSLAHCAAISAKRGYTAPVNEMLNKGVNVTIGTDNMSGDIVEAIRFTAIAARHRTGIVNLFNPMDILEMATINGAKALGLEKELGSIEAGKRADLVLINPNNCRLAPIFSESILSDFLHYGVAGDVDTTIVNGKILVEGGELKAAVEEEIITSAQRTAEAALAKLRG